MSDDDLSMSDADVEDSASKAPRGTKRRRSGNSSNLDRNVRGASVDSGIDLEDDFAALGDVVDAPEVDLSTDDVLVARKMSKGRMRYYTRQEFKDKYGNSKNLRDQVLLIKGEDGIRRTLPQVYYSAKIPEGTSRRDAHRLRKEHFVSEMRRLDMDYVKADFKRTTYQALKAGDPKAQYDTPGGKRTRRHIYENEPQAGAQLPDVMYRRKGRLIGGWATTDPNLKGKSFSDLKKLSGVELKSSNHSFSTAEQVDKQFGRGTAEARYEGYFGRKVRPNKSLPKVLVKVGDKYVSADFMLKHHPKASVSKAMGGSERHLGRLKALVLNDAGTSYMHPGAVKRLDPAHYENMAAARSLPERFSSIKKDFRMGRIMIQASENVFRHGNDKAIEKYKGSFKKSYGDTRVFIQGDNKYGKPAGTMRMLRTYERGDNSIPKSVADDLGIEAKVSSRDTRRQARQKKYEMETDSGISDVESKAGSAASQLRHEMANQHRSRARSTTSSVGIG